MRKSIFIAILALMPTIALADGGASVSGFFWRVLVFTLFIGLLYKFAGNKVKSALAGGVDNAKKSIEDAEKASKDAKNELADYSKKISEMSMELGKMKDAARKTAEKEAELMVSEAERSATRVKDMTKRTINAEFEKAMSDLGREQLLAAIDGAEAIIATDNDTNKKQKYIPDNIRKVGA
jgi:F-type H+-transporting ATPase subunit b